MSVRTPIGKPDACLTLFDVSGGTTVRVAYQPSVVLEYQVPGTTLEGLKAKHQREAEGKSEQVKIGYARPCGARVTGEGVR